MLDTTAGRAEVGEFVGKICAYFRDFLETDFRRQRQPKRSVTLRDGAGNLTGISISKFPELVGDLWAALRAPIHEGKPFVFKASRTKYHSRINSNVAEVVSRHVASLRQEEFNFLAENMLAVCRDFVGKKKIDADKLREALIGALRTGLVNYAVEPLLKTLEPSLERQSTDHVEKSYDIKDELGAGLIADWEGPLAAAIATAIVQGDTSELQQVIKESVAVESIKRKIRTYFDTFHTSSFFDELHAIKSTLKLRENFETYLYMGALQHGATSYPVFYIPIEVKLEGGQLSIMADPLLYINKKALEFAAQETARELGKPSTLTVEDRIAYLSPEQSYAGVMQELLDGWCADLALTPHLNLASSFDQKARRSQFSISNAMHKAAFDKSDEALLNDYEELMSALSANSETTADFEQIVTDFLTKDPVNVNASLDREWDSVALPDRLVFQSPVPLNEEQRKILMALKSMKSRFIAIEGPPGTGKSHTITAIAFEAILTGRNVLVLSDKTEALDVVESKLNDVLNSVRQERGLENPILRLGRAGNTYGRILSSASIQVLKSHLRSSAASAAEVASSLQQGETSLKQAITRSVSQNEGVSLSDVAELHKIESAVAPDLPPNFDLVVDEVALRVIDAVVRLSQLLSKDDCAILKLLRPFYEQPSLGALIAFLNVQKPYSQIASPTSRDLECIRLFKSFHTGQLPVLRSLLAAYREARWPVLGFAASGKALRKLEARLEEELSPISALNAHKSLKQFEAALVALSKLSAALTQAGCEELYQCLVFQQIIQGMPALSAEHAAACLSDANFVLRELVRNPHLSSVIGIDPDSIEKWTVQNTSAEARRLHRIFFLAIKARAVGETFRRIPHIDYVGEKSRLESLHARTLAHTLDKQVVEFAENHANTAKSLRDIIRKKQRFPRESFGALQKAFPCMIASIRDFGEYIPLDKDLFDVVVIDEASQVSIAQALPAFVRAKKLVVLGDRRQFSNVKTATASIETNNLYTNSIIEDFSRHHETDATTLNRIKLFNIKTSVLEFVERIANATFMLRKHFRSYPELISLSSEYFYQGQLQAVKIRGLPIDEVIKFTSVADDGKAELQKNVNQAEYQAVLAELRRLVSGPTVPTVGIITPHTEQQAYFVQKLSKETDFETLQDRLNLKVMTFDSCQGEERDVILYSMVATAQQNKLSYIFPKLISAGDDVEENLRLQRINVGFSRAKEAINVFHSIPLEEFQGAIGQVFAHYRGQLEAARKLPDVHATDQKSPMEARVLTWLKQTSFVQTLVAQNRIHIHPQFELGAYLRQLDRNYRHPQYRVDFLLIISGDGQPLKIIVEYDGFKEHFTQHAGVNSRNFESYYKAEDIERQHVLESYGYRFLRINRFNLGKNPAATLDARLTKLMQGSFL